MSTRKKIVIITVFAVLLLLAVLAAALNAVFTVSVINANFRSDSEMGRKDAEQLQKTLDREFLGKSSLFLDLAQIEERVSEYPAFRIDALEKRYPQEIYLEISERKEQYAVKMGETFAILDEDLGFLYYRSENSNRHGGENILVEGFAFTQAGDVLSGEYYEQFAASAKLIKEAFGEARANVVSFTLRHRGAETSKELDCFLLEMKEGVEIMIDDPSVRIAEKMSAALLKYSALDETQKLFGTIDVVELDSGEISAEFTRRDV